MTSPFPACMAALQSFLGLPIVHDLGLRQLDLWLDQPCIPGGITGSSCGGLAALSILQATSNCSFHGKVSQEAVALAVGVGACQSTGVTSQSQILIRRPEWRLGSCLHVTKPEFNQKV